MTAPKAKRMPSKPLPTRVLTQAPLPVPATAPPTPAPAPAPASPAQAANGKKKKKKKGKGKGVALGPQYDGDDEEDEDMQELIEELPVNGRPRSGSRAGLSPELESVHLSTTASLSASVAAAARLSPTAVAEAELLATADHLARSMEVDPEGMVNDEYWASFPDHLRNFVRHTYSQLSSPGNEDEKTQAMYAIAQQIHSGAGVNFTASATVKGTTRTATARYPPGAFPTSMPFDPSIFTDPAFTQAMERAAANGLQLPSDRHVHSPGDGGMLNEYGSEEHDYADEEYFSEEEVDELEEQRAQFTVSYEQHAGTLGAAEGNDNDDGELSAGQRKKNRKKKKKGRAGTGNGGSGGDSVGQTPVPAAAPGRPASAVGAVSPVPTTNLATPVSASHKPMPAPRPPPAANPPPSSRAAGKQPMSYSTPAPANPPPQSRRAASKAPITSHAYQHNHAHHHPSPPSSNASAPHKPRPPANGAGSAANGKTSSKIWSTSTTEERERIKEFWLGLGEDERRNLVKIEKEAVLRKMKEQQKHSCMCAVCGRKRSVLLILYRFFSSLTLSPTDSLPCTIFSPLAPSTVQTLQIFGMKLEMLLRRSSRYCTMLITKSLNSTRTTSSNTSPLAAPYLPLKAQAPSLEASSWTRMVR